MNIDKIQLENFRGIENVQLDIDGKSTVLYGINGVGKSSVLQAVNLLFSNLINKIVERRFKQGISLGISDITHGKSNCIVSSTFKFDNDQSITYTRSLDRKTKEPRHAKSISEFTSLFNSLYLNDESDFKSMPIFVNYGVNRAVLDVPLRIRTQHNFDRLAAFENSIKSSIDFRVFFEWFRYQEDLENQIKVANVNLEYEDVSLSAVRYAISEILEDITDIRVQRNPLSLVAKKNNGTLRIEQMSDGEKCTLALLGDLARRLSLANPEMDNPLHGFGIVLIDEIELHMHPAWQRKIVVTLKKIFPNIQFFVTTHSPQVLGELDDTFNVIAMKRDHDNKIVCDFVKTYGKDTNLILESFMDTDSVLVRIKELTSTVFQAIQIKDYERAASIANEINRLSDGTNEDVVKANILIARGRKCEKDIQG